MRNGFGRDAHTRIYHADNGIRTFAGHLYAHPSILGSELESVRQQVVYHLINILGYEIGLHRPIGNELQVDVSFCCKVTIAFHNHTQMRRKVGIRPFGTVYSRSHPCKIKQLVDEC